MEVITEFTLLFYWIFTGLGMICAGIIITIFFKKNQKYKLHQHYRKDNLNSDIVKIENVFNETLRHLDELENFIMQYKIEPTNELLKEQIQLEIYSIRGKIQHQLGHMPRMRCNLK